MCSWYVKYDKSQHNMWCPDGPGSQIKSCVANNVGQKWYVTFRTCHKKLSRSIECVVIMKKINTANVDPCGVQTSPDPKESGEY